VVLDSKKANTLFKRNDLILDTSFLADTLQMKAFEEEIGPGKPLQITLGMRNPRVEFG